MIKDVGHKPVVGEKLTVVTPSWHRGKPSEVVTGEVTKVGREWATIVTQGKYPREMRFRIRTQYTENGSNYNSRYLTEEQHKAEKEWEEAAETFRENGIEINWKSGLRDHEKFTRLAKVVKEMMEE